MKLASFPYETVDWSSVEATVHPGEAGTATWRTKHLGDVRVRLVEYSPGYRADHWCVKGHVVLCLEGEFRSELADGRVNALKAGTGYLVADGEEPHRSSTEAGAKLFIVD